MFVINISLGPIGKMDAASCLLTEASADEMVIRSTARHLQPTQAAIFTMELIVVATVKSEGMLCLLFDIIWSVEL